MDCRQHNRLRTHSPDGKPRDDNTNVLGLIAQGVIKVVNPTNSSSPYVPSGQIYQPIGNSRTPSSTYPGRWLSDPNYCRGRQLRSAAADGEPKTSATDMNSAVQAMS